MAFHESTQGIRYTIVDFLMSIAIIGLLVSIVISLINPAARLAQGRDAQRIAALKQLGTALQAYHTKYNTYPAMTEPYEGWERSECNDESCTGSPAPFMEYLIPEYLDVNFADPLRGSLSDQDRMGFGYLYQPDGGSNNQGFCLLTQLETHNNILKLEDDDCDDAFDNEVDDDATTSKFYAVGSSAEAKKVISDQ